MTFFFYGLNSFALRSRLDEMVAGYIAKNGSDFGLERIDASSAKPADIRSSLQATPFLANSRLVIIYGLASSKGSIEKLGNVLELVPTTTVAVFVDPEVDQRTTTFKMLNGADRVLKFDPLTQGQLIPWIRQEVDTRNGTLGPGGAQELIKAAGDDQWRLQQEISKLVAYNSEVTVESIQQLVAYSIEQNVFAVTDAMLSGRVKEAVNGVANLLAQQQSELGLLALMQGQLRNVLLASAAPTLRPAELAKAAGIKPYPAEKAIAAAKRIPEAVSRQAFLAAVDCEEAIKSGQQKADIALERLVYAVARMMSKGNR